MKTYDDGLRWAAQWIEDSLKGETNERVIQFGKNMAMTLRAANVQDVDRCVKCGHSGRVNQHGVCVQIRDGVDTDYYEGNPCCMCECEFPSPSVSEAAPEHCKHNRSSDEYCFDCVREKHNEDMLDGRFDEDYIEAVHQPPEQNLEDKNSVSGASDSSQIVISGDSSESADHTQSKAWDAIAAALRQGREMERRRIQTSVENLRRSYSEPFHVGYNHAIDDALLAADNYQPSRSSEMSTQYKVGDRLRNIHAAYLPIATVTEITERGFNYKLDRPLVISPRLGTQVGGESYEDSQWELMAEQPSTSDVLGNPERGTSVRNQTESSSESASTLVTEVSKEQDNAKS